MVKKLKKNKQFYIKRGKHIFIHVKSPLTSVDAAKLMLNCMEVGDETMGIRSIRKKKK